MLPQQTKFGFSQHFPNVPRKPEIVIATGQLVGEGTDIVHFDVLFLVYPFSSAIKLKQYIGRLQRGSQQPCMVYDYHDQWIGFFEQMFKKRKAVYKKHFGVNVDIK
ncbi:MAG: hypothetical protein HYV32_05940 [Candidatus Kerfeldbacteria bacterium]|nr:hypothetical protein [Candidatus Kerfeldbacteria bacterium]